MVNYNIFAQNGINAPDDAVRKIFRLFGRGASLNWELLHKAKNYSIQQWPEDADQISKEFDEMMYYTKKRLAARGLLYETSENISVYDETSEEDYRFEEIEDEER